MSWTELQPIVRTSPRVKAWIRIVSAGAQLGLTLSETYHKELGKPKTCDVSAGAGDNAGKLRIVFGKTGRFPITEMKHMARIILPPFAGLPDGARESEPCTIEAQASTQVAAVIVTLPIAAWERQVAKPAAVATPTKPAAAPSTNGHAGKVDLEAYLKKKGKKVTRLSSSQFVIDGERQTIGQALIMANDYRKRESLRPLTLEECQ